MYPQYPQQKVPQDREQKKTKNTQQKKNAVIVLGTPTYYLDMLDVDSKKNNVKSLHQLQKFRMVPKEYLKRVKENIVDETIASLIEEWEKKMEQEDMFMQKIFCNDKYTQHYVNESFYLPRIYCPKEQGNNDVPIYIVVPSLSNLVQGIFFEQDDSPIFDMPRSEDEKTRYRVRLEKCIKIFNQYMAEVYELVDIKALVINYDATKANDSDAALTQVYHLERIDILIRSFGKFLYRKEASGQYTINPQVFWLNWSKSKLNKQKLYIYVKATWFQLSREVMEIYRQVYLLYPFVKANEPKEREKDEQERTLDNTLDSLTPNASLAQDKVQQMALLNVDDILSFTKDEKEQKELEEHKASGEQKGQATKAAEAQVFEGIRTRIIDVVNNKETHRISPHQFRLEFGIRYHYTSLYKYTHYAKNLTLYGIKRFLSEQGDAPIEEVNEFMITHDGLASYIDTYKRKRDNLSTKDHQEFLRTNIENIQEYELQFWDKLNLNSGSYGDGYSMEYITSIIDNNGGYIGKVQPQKKEGDASDHLQLGDVEDVSIDHHDHHKAYNKKVAPSNMGYNEVDGDKLQWQHTGKAATINVMRIVVVFIFLAYCCYIFGKDNKTKRLAKEIKQLAKKIKQQAEEIKQLSAQNKQLPEEIKRQIEEKKKQIGEITKQAEEVKKQAKEKNILAEEIGNMKTAQENLAKEMQKLEVEIQKLEEKMQKLKGVNKPSQKGWQYFLTRFQEHFFFSLYS